MNDLIELYREAENQGIDVDWFSMEDARSLSIMFPNGKCCIAIDPWKMYTIADENVTLSHEIGHCCTGSFYNIYAARDIRQKHENKADKWAIKHLISQSELDRAVAEGHTELWDLADYFNVTEDFMRKAVCWYKNGNLATGYY